MRMMRNLTDFEIEEVALANGFKLKEQPNGLMALNPYVFDFARALFDKAQVEQTKREPVIVTGGGAGGGKSHYAELRTQAVALLIEQAIQNFKNATLSLREYNLLAIDESSCFTRATTTSFDLDEETQDKIKALTAEWNRAKVRRDKVQMSQLEKQLKKLRGV